MPDNKIKALRTKRGMTQRQLAAVAETSQQQIQRIESGVQTARFDIALRICAALEATMEQVFPATKKALKKSANKGNTVDDLLRDEDVAEELRTAGVEMSGEVRTVKFLLRNGFMGFHVVTGVSYDQLWSAVQRAGHVSMFEVYDTHNERVAINLKHLAFAQFLFDPAAFRQAEETSCAKLKVYMSMREEPLEFGIDPDTEDYITVMEGDADEDSAQLQSLMDAASLCSDDDDVFSFSDEDGEHAFFRAGDVSMITVPLSYIEPKLFQSEMDGYREDEGEGDEG